MHYFNAHAYLKDDIGTYLMYRLKGKFNFHIAPSVPSRSAQSGPGSQGPG